jgi:glutathione S-transferase
VKNGSIHEEFRVRLVAGMGACGDDIGRHRAPATENLSAVEKFGAMLKVLGKTSSINVRKVLWLCAEMALKFEHVQWGEGFRTTDTLEFKALNPNALVPVLRDGSVVLWESNTICRYLAHRYLRPDLLPTDARGRARVEQWMDWQATELNDSWQYAFMALVRKSPQHGNSKATDDSVRSWNRNMEILDGQLSKTRAYVAGDTFTLADIVIGLSVSRWFLAPIARANLPAVYAYYERLSTRPAFRMYGRNGPP